MDGVKNREEIRKMNKIMLCGRLTGDPTIHNGTVTVANYSLAVDRKFKKEGEPTADFFRCVAFGKQADFVHKYLSKGTKIILTGRIQNDNYTNKNNEKVYGFSVITEEIEFAESKGKKEETTETTEEWLNIPDGIDEELPFL